MIDGFEVRKAFPSREGDLETSLVIESRHFQDAGFAGVGGEIAVDELIEYDDGGVAFLRVKVLHQVLIIIKKEKMSFA